jgi:stage V sporulation protein R
MIERVRLHRDRIAQYEEEFGAREVENFLDCVLCIEEHFDPQTPFRRSIEADNPEERRRPPERTSEYEDIWGMLGDESVPAPRTRHFPPEPEKDLLLFLARYGRDLDDWQRDIISMMREEMLYFLPQIRTKIMNEGFASLAHERILEQYLTRSEDIWEFRRLHSGVLSPSPSRTNINPYYVGFQILKDIERRWNGEVENGDEPETDWLGAGRTRPRCEGWAKVFEVCEIENDPSFLRKYLTESLVKRLDLYTYEKTEVDGQEVWAVKSTDWEQVRDEMVDGMTNFGVPIIRVEDGDFNRHGELYLRHAYDGKALDAEYSQRVLHAIYRLWGRPVHLETRSDDRIRVLSYDGENDVREPKPG